MSRQPPANEPRFKIGDWAFNNTRRAMRNERVTGVWWDASLNNFKGGWRYAVPGLDDPNLPRERPDMPYAHDAG